MSSSYSPGIIKGNYYLIISSIIKRKVFLLEATLGGLGGAEQGPKAPSALGGAPWAGWPSHRCLPEVAQPP